MTARVPSGSSGAADRQALLRQLPAVDEVARQLGAEVDADMPRLLLVDSIRAVLDRRRRRILESPEAALGGIDCSPGAIAREARAHLAADALAHLERVAGGYSNLELDLATKERGSRYVHVEGRLRRLTGAEAALVVN